MRQNSPSAVQKQAFNTLIPRQTPLADNHCVKEMSFSFVLTVEQFLFFWILLSRHISAHVLNPTHVKNTDNESSSLDIH